MIDSLMAGCLQTLETAFRSIEVRVPPPRMVELPTGPSLRYVERTINQALVQKFARQISGLHAVRVLMGSGLGQEQAVIQRTLDEINEDIVFLSLAAISGDVTELHQRYLEDFWSEEFDQPTALASSQRRGMVKRRNVRAFISRHSGLPDPSSQDKLSETIHKAYSGFVHAASPQVMDMCGGNPPRFHLSGLQRTPRMAEHRDDGLNYFFRGLVSAAMVAKAFGVETLAVALTAATDDFERFCGPNYFRPGPEELDALRHQTQ